MLAKYYINLVYFLASHAKFVGHCKSQTTSLFL